MYRAVHAAAPQQRLIGGVNDGIDRQGRDVRLDKLNAHGSDSL
jgi:hypothetical protein